MLEAPAVRAGLIAGAGRSGTTWVLDALAEANGLRTVFEPLHPVTSVVAAAHACRYLRPDTEDVDAHAFFASVFEGALHSTWTDYRVRPDRLRPTLGLLTSSTEMHRFVRRWRKLVRHYRQYAGTLQRPALLVKCIRANLMLGWIRAHFAVPVVLMLRHPGAVVESRLRLSEEDWNPFAQLRRYREQEALQADYLFKYNALLHDNLSPVEAHTALWCIENQLPLTQLRQDEVTIVFYEHLTDPNHEDWRRVLATLELPRMPDDALLRVPSQQASLGRSAGEYGRELSLADWHDRLGAARIAEMQGVLSAFDVSAYDLDSPLPRSAALSRTRGSQRSTEP